MIYPLFYQNLVWFIQTFLVKLTDQDVYEWPACVSAIITLYKGIGWYSRANAHYYIFFEWFELGIIYHVQKSNVQNKVCPLVFYPFSDVCSR